MPLCIVRFSFVVLSMPHAMAEVFSSKPWERKRYTTYETGSVYVSLACPAGFSLSCKPICCDGGLQHLQATCADFGINFTLADSSYCSAHDYNTRSHECCECVSLAPPITSQPQTTELVRAGSEECKLAYPKWPEWWLRSGCNVANLTPLTSCTIPGRGGGTNIGCPAGYAARAMELYSSYCIFDGYQYLGTSSWVCQTCVQEMGTTTITTTATRYGPQDPTCLAGGFRDWEAVGVEGASACRGNHSNDNNASHYHVVPAYSIDECKGKCILELPECKGVEYSFGRCEIWTRPEGLFVTKNISGFTCLRYGWPTKYLQPMDGGTDRVCRRTSPTDNQDYYYRVQKTRYLEDCKGRCAASRSRCEGIEYSLGRCELWIYQIAATTNITGFQCFQYSDPRKKNPADVWVRQSLPSLRQWLCQKSCYEAPTGADSVG